MTLGKQGPFKSDAPHWLGCKRTLPVSLLGIAHHARRFCGLLNQAVGGLNASPSATRCMACCRSPMSRQCSTTLAATFSGTAH